MVTLGTWNMQTLLNRDKVKRPDRRTALIAREFARFNMNMAALCETHLQSHHQHQEDRSYVPACPWQELPETYQNSARFDPKCSGQIHLPGEYTVKTGQY